MPGPDILCGNRSAENTKVTSAKVVPVPQRHLGEHRCRSTHSEEMNSLLQALVNFSVDKMLWCPSNRRLIGQLHKVFLYILAWHFIFQSFLCVLSHVCHYGLHLSV